MNSLARLSHICLTAIAMLCANMVRAEDETRTALVIGNGAYRESPLSYPVNDVKTIANILKSLDFQVTLLTDITRNNLRRAIRDFAKTLKEQRGVGLFYFSGHGVQVKERNYMMPLQADVVAAFEVPDEGVEFGYVINAMIEAKNDLNIVMFDSSPSRLYSARLKEIGPGMAYMEAPDNMLISYSAAPGSVSMPVNGQNSEYARLFIKNVAIPNVQVEEVFKSMRVGMEQATKGKQEPWQSSSLQRKFVFVSDNEGVKNSSSAAMAADTSAWELIKTSEDINELENFLQQFPGSIYKLAVEQRIKNLKRQRSSQ